jgi:hypothetical protein
MRRAGPRRRSGLAREPDRGYGAIVDGQDRKPRSRFSPCALVTQREARAILGRRLAAPREAPLGPTCIYRTAAGRPESVTIAVQTASIRALRGRLRDRETVPVARTTGYCGTLGQPTLVVAVAPSRVLSIAAPCDTARRFAGRAIPRLRP